LRNVTLGSALAIALIGAPLAFADGAPAPDSTSSRPAGSESARPASDGLEHLVPELAGKPFGIEPGTRSYLHHIAVGPAFGRLGSDRLFALRVAYSPQSWLAYEGSIGHVPSHAVQGIVHMLSVIVRHPFRGRFQPYLSGGYGMTVVLPGQSLNADPVTKNTLAIGGGLEFFVRSDLALRAEMRATTVLGREQNQAGTVSYEYNEQTIGLEFYRSTRP
jgi:hypothetical protein